MNQLHNKPCGVVLGGDLRQIHLANRLSEQMSIFLMGMDDLAGGEEMLARDIQLISSPKELLAPPNFLFLPMPVMNGESINAPLSHNEISLSQALSFADWGGDTFVFGGKIDPPLTTILTQRQIPYCDYMAREELAVMNAIATAEGAIEVMLREIPVTIFGLNVMIVGSGRISKTLRTRLVSLGAHVTVSGRNPADLAWIEIDGCTPIFSHQLADKISAYDVIVNTVPAKILDQQVLSQMNPEALLLDLASKPGGVDFAVANTLGIRTIWALSLPGKTAPISSGEIIYQVICHIIEEELL